jgi:hypothetical protein
VGAPRDNPPEAVCGHPYGVQAGMVTQKGLISLCNRYFN